MREVYTQQTLDLFFKEFKNIPNSYQIDRVHQLLNSPDAMAMQKVRYRFKPFKLFIMTSTFIVSIGALLLLTTPRESSINSNSNVPKENSEVLFQENDSSDDFGENEKLSNRSKYTNLNEIDSPDPKHAIESAPEEMTEALFVNSDRKISTIDSNSLELEKDITTDNVSKPAMTMDIEKTAELEGLNLIELAEDELRRIGFIINESTIYHFSRSDDCVWKIFFSSSSEGCEHISINALDQTKPNFVFLSDTNGFQSIKWSCPNDAKSKWDDEYFKDRIQELVPFVLRKNDYPNLLFANRIFWFEPSNELFDNLPSRIAMDLKQEYYDLISANDFTESEDPEDSQVSSQEVAGKENLNSCNYFEHCRSTLSLETLKIFPNPARADINIEFSLREQVRGRISLVSITGAEIKVLVPTANFRKGSNSFTANIQDIDSGIFLITILTDKGVKTQRIIISK